MEDSERGSSRAALAIVLSFSAIALFRGLLDDCVQRWSTEPQYSHGFVIPLIAVGLAWWRRNRIPSGAFHSSRIGLVLIVMGSALHLVADFLYVSALDAAAFLLVLSGIVLMVWGRRVFTALWPAVLFPVFMLPLPFQIEQMLSGPLQLLGASEGAYCIQCFGIPAIAQGNTILMGTTRLGVEEACSGLRMLMVFLAISAAAMIISERPRSERVLMLLSAIPIALICNIGRIVATALTHHYFGRVAADRVMHDLSGWLMMPAAILLLWLELKLLDWVFVEVDDRLPGMQPTSSFPGIFKVQTHPRSSQKVHV